MDPELATSLVAEADLTERLAVSEDVERLAVLATFDPARLDGAVHGEAILRLLCRRLRTRDGHEEAILTERRRVDVLARMLREYGPDGPKIVRSTVRPDYETPLQRVLDAVLGGEPQLPVDLDDENDLLAAIEVLRWADQAFAHADLPKPVVQPAKDEILGRLALLDVTHAVRRLVEAGCVGRDDELTRLHAYRTAANGARSLSDDPAMVVYGVGGVGKSTLVARFVMDLYEQLGGDDTLAWAYVDLDRPTLASGDPLVVLNDIVSQIAAQFPVFRRVLRRRQEIAYQRTKGAGLEAYDTAHSLRSRASEFADAFLQLGARSLVVVVDTFEELERRDPARSRELYDLFDVLSDGIGDFRLVVSGRRPAASFVDGTRPDRSLHVEPLKDDAAVTLLRHFVDAAAGAAPAAEVRADVARDVIDLVGGIPLTVRLAATVLVREGPGAVADAAAYARTMEEVRAEFIRGFLYQRILDHIDVGERVRTEQLRGIARASLALRRISRGLIGEVLVPAVCSVPAPPVDEVFEQLAAEVALVEVEGDALTLREELRGPALAALKLTDAELVDEVHRRAVDYFAGGADPDARLELAYHRLALGQVHAVRDPAILRQLAPSVPDLPAAAAELVRRALRDPESLEATDELARWEHKVLAECETALRKGELDRVAALLAGRTERTAGTELHRLESRLAEARHDLATAAAAAEGELAAAIEVSDAARAAAAAVRLAGLRERVGGTAAAESVLSGVAGSRLLAGRPELRLELLLTRMTLLERRASPAEEERWASELAVRSLLQRSNPRATSEGAVVRLLAAALGRDEPERIRTAVRHVGLGFDEDAERVKALAGAIAAWDAAGPEPGSLARAAGLRPRGDGLEELTAAWSAISGLGTQAGPLLDRVWSAGPPEEVREAFRRIYLWWGLPAEPGTGPAATRGHEPGAAIDWSQPEVQALEEILLTAYHSLTDIQVLASRAGLGLEGISWSSSLRRVVRELLSQADAEHRVGPLTDAILADPETVSVHPPLEELRRDPAFGAWVGGA
jgi:hypothetical protein